MGDFCIKLAYQWWRELPSRERTREKLLDILDHACQAYAVSVTAELEARAWDYVPQWQKGAA